MYDISIILYLAPPFLIGYVLGFLRLRPLLVAGSLFALLLLVFFGVLAGFIATPQEGHQALFAFALVGPILLVYGTVICAIIYAGMLCGKAVREKRDYE